MVALFVRGFDDVIPGALSPLQQDSKVVMRSTEMVAAVFDGDSWTEPERLTYDAVGDMTPALCTYSTPTGPVTMGVWVTDEDGDALLTRHDRQLVYSLFDGTTWTPPQVLAHNVTTKDTPALGCLESSVLLAYTHEVANADYEYIPSPDPDAVNYDSMMSPYFYKAFYRFYNTSTGIWGEEIKLIANSLFEHENVSEGFASVSTRDGRFVAAWLHNDTLVYKLLSPNEPDHPVIKLSNGEQVTMVTMSSHPSFTSVTWTSSLLGGYYYSLMEAGVQTFGGAVFVPKESADTSDTYVRGVLVDQDNGTPLFLRLYAERDRITNPETNETTLGTARIEFDLVSLVPQLRLSEVSLVQGNESSDTSVVVSLGNAGAISMNPGLVEMKVYEGDRNRIDGARLLGTARNPFLPSGANTSVSVSFSPTPSFPGYVWVLALDAQTGAQLWNASVPFYQPYIASISFAQSDYSADFVSLKVVLWNAVSFPSAPVTMPISVWAKDDNDKYAIIAAYIAPNVSHASDPNPTFVTLEVNSSLITTDLRIVAGEYRTTPFTIETVPPISLVGMYEHMVPAPNAAIVSPSDIVIVNSFVGNVLLQVNVTNTGLVPMVDATVGVFLYDADFLPENDPAYLNSLAYAVIPFLAPMTSTPVLVSLAAWPHVGSIDVTVMVNPYKSIKEHVYEDNAMLKHIDVYPRWKLSIPKEFVTLNAATSVVSFVLMNSGVAVEEVTIPVYHYQAETGIYELLDRITFANVSSNRCVIGIVQGANFTSTSEITLTLPAFYTGSSESITLSVPAPSAMNGRTPNCNRPLFSSPSVAHIEEENLRAHVGKTFTLLVLSDADAGFPVNFEAGALPLGATFTDNGDNTGTLLFTPSWFHSSTGSMSVSAEMHLIDSGVRYGGRTFTIMVLAPVVFHSSNSTNLGGTVTIVGDNFGSNPSLISVEIGGSPCVDVTLVEDDHAIACVASPGSGTLKHIAVTVDSVINTDDNLAFSYLLGFLFSPGFHGASLSPLDPPRSFSVSPTFAPPLPLTLTPTCSGVPAGSSCAFVPETILFAEGTETASFTVQVSAPPSFSASDLEFTISYAVSGYEFLQVPEDTHFGFGVYLPRNDLLDFTTGGDIVVDGYNLGTSAEAYQVSYAKGSATVECEVTEVSGSVLTIRVPPGTGKNLTLSIYGEGRPLTANTFSFSYTSPSLFSVLNAPPTQGGLATISGANFGTRASAVAVAILPDMGAVDVAAVDDESIVILVPAGSGARYGVEVRIEAGGEYEVVYAENSFSYQAPTITSVSLMPVAGGLVTISGSNFGNNISNIEQLPGTGRHLQPVGPVVSVTHSQIVISVPAGRGQGYRLAFAVGPSMALAHNVTSNLANYVNDLGSVPENPATSCNHIRSERGVLSNGVYYVAYAGGAVPVLCDFQMFPGKAATMIFKISNGVSGDPYTLWSNANPMNHNNANLLNVDRSTVHYVSPFVSTWGRVGKVSVRLYQSGVQKKFIDFASSSTRMNFFNGGNALASSWNDFPTTTVDNSDAGRFFSIVGLGSSRRWYINNNFGGCPSDKGWLLVTPVVDTCESYFFPSGAPTRVAILYSSGSYMSLASSYARANVMAVWADVE